MPAEIHPYSYSPLENPIRLDMQSWPDGTRPLVSICCMTYNHGKFIEECLSGFLMQETTFPVEILIHDDASTDGTDKVIQRYRERYPLIIKPIYQTENQYSKGVKVNPAFNWPRAKGAFIALCEGDDYWVDGCKLQKQVEILWQQKDVAMVFHAVDLISESGIISPDTITSVPREYALLEDIAEKGNYVHTPSVVYRNLITEFPSELNAAPIGDYCLYNLVLEIGKAYYIPEKMAIYRHGTGTWSSRSQRDRDLGTITAFFCLYSYFSKKKNTEVANIYRRRIESTLKTVVQSLSLDYVENWIAISKWSRDLLLELLLTFAAEGILTSGNSKNRAYILVRIRNLASRLWGVFAHKSN